MQPNAVYILSLLRLHENVDRGVRTHRQIICRMRKPVAEHNIHIVGEAYSYSQGWVEGALDTAESTLQEFFGLKIPTWLAPKDYSLLPSPCPGCDDLESGVKCKECAKVLDAITMNHLRAVEEA